MPCTIDLPRPEFIQLLNELYVFDKKKFCGTECDDSRVSMFARNLFRSSPKKWGNTQHSKEEENCNRKLDEHFQANFATELLIHTVDRYICGTNQIYM